MNKIIIIGAGPAGISAAICLAKKGIKTTIIDESPKVGGVIYRGPWRKTIQMPHLDDKLKAKMKKLKSGYIEYQDLINLRLNTRVLGPQSNQSLLINHNDTIQCIDYDFLLLATGCQERSIPFPGWQLPGVMLMGGIQLQLKSGLVRPGVKIALVGTGPLLALITCQLHKAGCQVIGVYEASPFYRLAKEVIALMNRPQLVLEGLSMMNYIKQHKIPFHYGWGIVEAHGKEALQKAIVAPYDKYWQPNLARSKAIMVDTLGVGYGFSSRSQLAQLLHLDMEYDEQSGLIPKVDQWQCSSSQHIYAAGDNAYVVGADAAMIEGTIAAESIAAKLGKNSISKDSHRIIQLRRRKKRIYRFRHAFDRISKQQHNLLNLAKENTTICRCENVKKQAIEEALAEGCQDIVSLKMKTRVTMGDCQGKVCSHYCYDRLAAAGFRQQMGVVRPRFPLDPIPFSALLKEGLSDE
ncbi:NAD(P)/FAD-dependent oxidoreductase [Piscirickettsia litoralis]|uniref:FAD/NAD(P)-binding oxidoreductase n=1 Tax=Piscirickettsia litoralis TaxID=1891921 RepID=A0ABX3A0N4_9GAMM|nr:FAD/NAD(P)-binding oxidoreductase [Piscirickettsia litoralis]ODN42424.1 FAD/NAD(P)-binding oxidoreductase [Piscirickettsia litoralis]